MELTNNDILLIEQYCNGELQGAELAAFNQRMENDAAFKGEVLMHQSIVSGLQQFGKNAIKKNIAAIGATIPIARMDTYTPSKNGGGSAPWGKIVTLVTVAGLAALAYYFWTSNETVRDFIFEKIEYIQQYEVQYDTIYHEIPSGEDIHLEDGTIIKTDTMQGDTVWSQSASYIEPKQGKGLDGKAYGSEFEDVITQNEPGIIESNEKPSILGYDTIIRLEKAIDKITTFDENNNATVTYDTLKKYDTIYKPVHSLP